MAILGTKNFSPEEWRCKCCGQLPPQWKDGEVPPILLAYQKYRDLVGKPVIITPHGGYRCPHQNKLSGGAPDSRHLHADAGDSEVEGMTSEEMAAKAEEVEEFANGGIGIYPGRGFVHLDVRGHKARWEG